MANDDLAEVAQLAEMVKSELTDVGLTVLDPDDDHNGVRIEVAENNVWVDWEPGPSLRQASIAALNRGAYRGDDLHPAMKYRGTVTEAMNEAIATILTAAGFDVRKDVDEYRPMELLVEAWRKVPHWRDPIVAPLDGASGFSPGVRVRVLTGDLAGAELIVASVKMSWSGEPMGYVLRRSDGDGLIDVAPADVEFADDETLG